MNAVSEMCIRDSGDAVLVQILKLLGVRAGLVGEHQRHTVVEDVYKRQLFALNAAQDIGLFRFSVGEEGLILRVDLVQRRFCDIDIALIDCLLYTSRCV